MSSARPGGPGHPDWLQPEHCRPTSHGGSGLGQGRPRRLRGRRASRAACRLTAGACRRALTIAVTTTAGSPAIPAPPHPSRTITGIAAGRSRARGTLLGDRVAAIYDQVLPGDVGGARAGQPGNGGGDLVG